MPRPPVDPDYFDKVNYVIDSWAMPCEAPWYIYVETLKPAALEAFIVLITFGWDDVLRGVFRPGGLGHRTMKRKGRWARKVPRFPEMGETIGKGLPVADQIEDFIKWGTKTRFLWRIDTAIQMALFAWLVVDVTIDFAFNWTSLLYETRWCQAENLGRFSKSGPGPSTIGGPGWSKLSFPNTDYSHPMPSWTLNHGNTGANPAIFAAGASVIKHPAFAPPSGCAIRIRDEISNKVLHESDVNDLDKDGNLSAAIGGAVKPYRSVEVDVWIDSNFAQVTDRSVTGQEIVD